jgi:hypothetical protein
MRAVAALASCCAAAAAAGCGGGTGSQPATPSAPAAQATLVVAGLEPPGGCYVTVFLVDGATAAQVAEVQQRLLAARGVTEVAFVSRELELRRFKALNPGAAKRMRANRFAGRFEVVPSARAGVRAIVGDVAANRGPVRNVKPSTGCSGPG